MVRKQGLTLLELQGKLKREPDAYRDDFLTQMRHFESLMQVFEMRPSEESKQFSELLSFISHTAPLYGPVAQHIPALLVKIVERHSSSIHPKMRRQIVMALSLLRNRDFVPPEVLLPFFFKLFKLNDKELRKHVLSHIINDVKRLNGTSKNQKINSTLQTFMYKVLEEDDITAAQYSLVVMIDLYRRRIWTSDQTVNIIAKAIFSKHTKIAMIALKFFLGKYAKVSVEEAEQQEENEEGITDKQLGKGRRQTLHQFKKGAKKTRARKARMKKDLKKWEVMRNKESPIDTLFPAVEVLFDPQSLAERLFSVLQRSHEQFEMRLLRMQVLSKCIACHELIVLNFYPYLERHMEPFQREVTQILLVAIESIHHLVPPEACQPLMKTMANHFINDKAEPDVITIGLNTVREMCRRQPLLMTEDFLHDISEYKSYKKDKGVSMAAKGVIYLYRELHPTMLKKKDRGKFHDADNKLVGFAAEKPAEMVPGTDLLYKYELEEQQKKLEEVIDRVAKKEARDADRAERQGSKKGGSSEAGELPESKEEDEEEEEEEEEGSKASDAASDGSGEWIDVSHSDDDSDAEQDDNDDEEEEEEGSGEGSDEEEAESDTEVKGKLEQQVQPSKVEARPVQMDVDDDDGCPELVLVDDCPELVLADDVPEDADEEDESTDEGEEEEGSDSDGGFPWKIDPLKLEAQKRQMLLDLHKSAAPAEEGGKVPDGLPDDAKSVQSTTLGQPMGSDAMTRILTARDFERIEKLMLAKKQINVASSTLKRRKKRAELMASLSEEMLEFGTDKRVKEKRDEKREQNALYREKFKAHVRKERKKGGSTHKDKERRKATIMVKHKETIWRKRKLSTRQKKSVDKKRQKTITKYKIKRGV